MTLIEQVVTLRFWGYTNKDIAEMLHANPVTTAVTWWKTINKSKHNYYASVYYYRNRDKILERGRERRANQSPEKKAEEAYKRKLRDCGVKNA